MSATAFELNLGLDFLKECEEEFKDRYSENDAEFMRIKLATPRGPPILDPYNNFEAAASWRDCWEPKARSARPKVKRYNRKRKRKRSVCCFIFKCIIIFF